jgi:hypothetical protein
MDMEMQRGDGHVAWIWTCSMEMVKQHGHGNATWTGHGHGYAACPFECPCFMSLSRLPIYVLAACPSTCYITISMLHAHIHVVGTWNGQWHAAWALTCNVGMDLLSCPLLNPYGEIGYGYPTMSMMVTGSRFLY